jgi:phosphate:Na+ symporter
MGRSGTMTWRTALIVPIGVVVAFLFATAGIAETAVGDKVGIDWLAFAMGCLGGLALFLYGVEILATALKAASGGRFQAVLERSVSNRFAALGVGTIATVALDSSSVVIILVITIVDAGLMAFGSALPVILGSNIGTTFSSQLFAWDVDKFAPVLIAAALLWKTIGKSDATTRHSNILLGLGLVLFGLNIIGTAAEPLRESSAILDALKTLENPLLGVLAGALATVAIQSSSAMMGIVITLAGGGLITLPAGLAIMLGAEIGTCADTLLATLGRSRSAVKAGIFHLLFNILSVAVGVMLIDALTRFGSLTASDTGQRIANAHVLFNVVGAIVVLPFVGLAARLLDRIVPGRGGEADAEVEQSA